MFPQFFGICLYHSLVVDTRNYIKQTILEALEGVTTPGVQTNSLYFCKVE